MLASQERVEKGGAAVDVGEVDLDVGYVLELRRCFVFVCERDRIALVDARCREISAVVLGLRCASGVVEQVLVPCVRVRT